MKFTILGSGSKGNCYLLESNSETLILELGLRSSSIKKGIKFDLDCVVGALVTHEHMDHAQSLFAFLGFGVDVYATQGTLQTLSSHHRAHVIKAKETFNIGSFKIMAFDTQHDANEPVGFLIEHPEMGKMLFATDTYYIKYVFKGLHHIVLECNYDRAILDKFITDGNPLTSQRMSRLLQSHFSIDNVEKFLMKTDLTLCQSITLIHLSDGHSDEKDFQQRIAKITGIQPVIANTNVVLTLNKHPF